jgi:DNA-binding transcriptional ArsR family regulator
MHSPDECDVPLGTWTAVIRRARIGPERKLAALLVASYADASGGSIHCGVARLALDLERSYATARRHLAWLRETGLIRLVRAGNKRRGYADEYQLILAQDLLERVTLPTPDEYLADMEAIHEANRTRRPVDNPDQLAIILPDQRSSWVSANQTVSDPISAHPG